MRNIALISSFRDSLRYLLKRLFSKEYRRQLESEERQRRLHASIRGYLSNLPRCEGRILIASTEDHDEGFSSDITMSARELLAWSREYAESGVIQNLENEIATQALPIWLAGSTFDIRKVSRLPSGGFRTIAAQMDT